MPAIASAQTTRDIWVILQKMYGRASPTRVLSLQERLQQSFKHPNQYVADFLNGTQAIWEDLAKIGHPVANFAYKLVVINGIQSECPELAASFRITKENLYYEDLYEVLVGCEAG